MCTLTHIFGSTTDETLKVQYMVYFEAGPIGICSLVMTAQILNYTTQPLTRKCLISSGYYKHWYALIIFDVYFTLDWD